MSVRAESKEGGVLVIDIRAQGGGGLHVGRGNGDCSNLVFCFSEDININININI